MAIGPVSTPASSPSNTPRSSSSRNVSFALPEETTAGNSSPSLSQRAITELSEKELLQLIALNQRNGASGGPDALSRRRRAKVAHVADEVLSRLPSLLSEYRVQVQAVLIDIGNVLTYSCFEL